MSKRLSATRGVVAALSLYFLAWMLLGGVRLLTADDRDYKLEGIYIEGCSCEQQNGCDLTGGDQNGCRQIIALALSGGKYMNVELEGAKLAVAQVRGDWVRIYVDAKNSVQREAVATLARGYFASSGRIDTVKEAKIDFSGDDGKYTVQVENGTILQLTTEPVIGADDKHPIRHENAKGRLSRVVFQGKTVSGRFSDGERNFDLQQGTAYFNNKLDTKGAL